MKKLLCLIFALFYAYTILNAQRNSIYLSFQPIDLGIGLRYDRQLYTKGLYTSLTWGNYRYEGGYINNHIKLAFGGFLSSKQHSFISAGVSGHYGDKILLPNTSRITIFPFSCEFGAGVRINKISTAFCFDPLKIESNICVGYNF